MITKHAKVGLQALAVIGSNAAVQILPPSDVSSQQQQPDSIYIYASHFKPTQYIANTFSSVPVVYDYELQSEYAEIGSALAEMKDLDTDDMGAIEPEVYEVASSVARELLLADYPAPKIFSHGPQSVVFNWCEGSNNLDLTVSADNISALLSSPAKIQRRIDFAPNALSTSPNLLIGLRAAHSNSSIAVRETASSEPFKHIG